MARTPLLVYSHLRWEGEFQRPQHVMSRIAETRPVLFIEEPVRGARHDSWERQQMSSSLTVHRPHVARDPGGFAPSEHDRFLIMLEQLAAREGIGRHTAWLDTPMAFPAAHSLAPEVMVYDCMDELANVRNAPLEIAELEHALLRQADLVFTGGPSLYRAKRGRHPNVHCFPSSVDVDHFRRGRAGHPVASEIAELPRPRLGYFGEIDERFDPEIIDAMAAAHPEWQIVLVGPIVRIDPAALLRHANVHYLGSRSYNELPGLLAGWDVSLMPFALNDATRFIGPTKTLECLATEHPIVSSPIRDVAGPYADLVYLGDGPHEFVKACERALAATPADRAARRERARAVLARTSWERTVRAMSLELRQVESRFQHHGRALEVTFATSSGSAAEPSWL